MFYLKDLKAFGKTNSNGDFVIAEKESGVATPEFKSVCEKVLIKAKGRIKENSRIALALYIYNDENNKIKLYSETVEIADNNFNAEYSFDAVNLAVYHGAVRFSAEIYALSDKAEFCVSEFSLEETNVDESTEEKVEISNITTLENGEKAVYVTQIDGKRITVPIVPKKVLFMGNSLLLGMFNTYGMCSTAPDKDYYYYVTSEILKYNKDCEFIKVHGVGLECCEKEEALEEWFFNEPNRYTNRPTVESFEKDIDLIIIQLGDNVNNEDKTTAFKKNAERFVKLVKERCPNARIIWAYGWYNKFNVYHKLMEVCEKWSIENIDLSHFHGKEFQACKGQISLNAEGEEVVVPDGWITHPGDKGMKRVADEMIAVIGIN